MKRTILIGLLAGSTFLPASARAQQRPGPPPRAELEERIRNRFGELVRRELGLTAEQLEEVQHVEVSFQQQRRELVRREADLRRRLRRAESVRDAEEARAMLEEMAAVREDEARLFRAEMDTLLETLSPEQVLRFYQLRDELMERVRRLRQPAMGPRPPRGALGFGG